ncbi:MAG: GYD domain-containing protein, partial [Chloroflexota bacterium]
MGTIPRFWKETTLTTYISLLNWTAQGISDVRDSVDRVHQGESLFKPFGARITHAYWTQGEYDLVVISEAPDDESMAAAMLA